MTTEDALRATINSLLALDAILVEEGSLVAGEWSAAIRGLASISNGDGCQRAMLMIADHLDTPPDERPAFEVIDGGKS